MERINDRILADNEESPSALEKKHVHEVYDIIADHFSLTRHSLWPVIKDFLKSIPPGCLIADVGCGNGKYMSVRPNESFYVGADYSLPLLHLCRKLRPKTDQVKGSIVSLPFRRSMFDHAICIAVIHHLSTEERRIEAIEELIRIVKQDGNILIFVWAFEQRKESKRQFNEQDVMVPWKLKGNKKETSDKKNDFEGVYQRYYHLFKDGELDLLVEKACSRLNLQAEIVRSGYDRDNWYCQFKFKKKI